jgi:hypothetical protein
MVSIEDRILTTYELLAEEPNEWVDLGSIREMVGDDVSREDMDKAFRAVDRLQGVTLIPEANRKTLTEKDNAAGVVIGGELNHLMQVFRRSS